jgi:hypothetical protein
MADARFFGQPVKSPLVRFQQIVDPYLDHDLSFCLCVLDIYHIRNILSI